jgi:hypothetical protein
MVDKPQSGYDWGWINEMVSNSWTGQCIASVRNALDSKIGRSSESISDAFLPVIFDSLTYRLLTVDSRSSVIVLDLRDTLIFRPLLVLKDAYSSAVVTSIQNSIIISTFRQWVGFIKEL